MLLRANSGTNWLMGVGGGEGGALEPRLGFQHQAIEEGTPEALACCLALWAR